MLLFFGGKTVPEKDRQVGRRSLTLSVWGKMFPLQEPWRQTGIESRSRSEGWNVHLVQLVNLWTSLFKGNVSICDVHYVPEVIFAPELTSFFLFLFRRSRFSLSLLHIPIPSVSDCLRFPVWLSAALWEWDSLCSVAAAAAAVCHLGSWQMANTHQQHWVNPERERVPQPLCFFYRRSRRGLALTCDRLTVRTRI